MEEACGKQNRVMDELQQSQKVFEEERTRSEEHARKLMGINKLQPELEETRQ